MGRETAFRLATLDPYVPTATFFDLTGERDEGA